MKPRSVTERLEKIDNDLKDFSIKIKEKLTLEQFELRLIPAIHYDILTIL